jgi:hypothetical protein
MYILNILFLYIKVIKKYFDFIGTISNNLKFDEFFNKFDNKF